MLGMLVVGLAGDAVAIAGGVAGQLLILLIELLGGAADPHFRAGAVKNMVPIERNTVLLVAETAAAIISPTTAVGAMVAATHALHIHIV